MSFRIQGLAPKAFEHLFGLDQAALRSHHARRVVADQAPGYPDRIQLRDAMPGESLLLLNYTHQPAANPYRASHAIYLLEGSTSAYDECDQVPPALALRTLSVRAFDACDELIDGDLVEGADLPALVNRLFANQNAAYLHAHYARYGCFAARIDRA